MSSQMVASQTATRLHRELIAGSDIAAFEVQERQGHLAPSRLARSYCRTLAASDIAAVFGSTLSQVGDHQGEELPIGPERSACC